MDDEKIVVTRTFKFEDPEEAFKQARRRITNNALRRQQRSLDLSDYGFAELPSEIGMLSSLTHLNLSGKPQSDRQFQLRERIDELTDGPEDLVIDILSVHKRMVRHGYNFQHNAGVTWRRSSQSTAQSHSPPPSSPTPFPC